MEISRARNHGRIVGLFMSFLLFAGVVASGELLGVVAQRLGLANSSDDKYYFVSQLDDNR